MRLAGYAAIFDAPDKGGDIVRKGAFARAAQAGLPLLWQHDQNRRIGFVESLSEDARGLRVIARLDDEVAPVRAGAGLSFGYRVRAMNNREYRELTDLDLIEVSVVASPMQPLARVLAVETGNKAPQNLQKENEMDYETKADALEAAFDGAVPAVAVNRPRLSGSAVADPARSAFVDGYLRRGSELELKSFNGVTPSDGGFAVPREIDDVIDSVLKSISPIRAISTVVRVGSAGYRKLVTQNGVTSGWAAETATRPETATPTFNEIIPSFGELYANPAATQAMLDDAAFDVEAWLADEIATEFAKAEGAAFINGNGTNRPRGFLTGPNATTSDATRPFGTLQYVATGVAGAFPASNPQDKLVELVHSLRAPYRQGACWVMNASTLSLIRRFKTADGAFLWQPAMAAGQPDTLMGYPVVEAEDMPDIAANSVSIAFGNFKAGYLIAERSETNILRDPYSNKPYVHFYATKRLGGTLINSSAIKLMKFSLT